MKKQLIALCCLVGVTPMFAQQIRWVYSTDDERWKEGGIITVVNDDPTEVDDVLITKYKEQQIDGFGGTFNELGWDALNLLPKKEKQAILDELFEPGKGMNFTFCRTTIGANDYSRDWYSLNEHDGDFEMKHFSIAREKKTLIPYIKSALKINPDLRIWASPWSPPTWMKTNKHYATVSGDHNDLPKDKQVTEGDHFIQEPRYLAAYADYLSKYVSAYEKQGINIEMVQFQNEPYTRNQWPTCLWTPEAMRRFLFEYLIPVFGVRHPDVELWLGTINCNRIEDIDVVMSHPDADKYIKGIGLQWEGKDIVSNVHRKYPHVKIMQTENECGGGTFDWNAAEYTFSLIRRYIGGGASSYMYWNMILKDRGTSTWGWHQNAMIVVDSKTKKVNYTPEFYIMKHLSHFVKPGAHKMKTMGKDRNLLAFKNPDGETVILIVNTSDHREKTTVSLNGKVYEIKMKPNSFNTITIK